MNLNKIFIISILLIIITIGAVSATENIGNSTDEKLSEAPDIALENDNEDKLNDPDLSKFNVKITDKQIDVNDDDAVIVSFDWPDFVNESNAYVKVDVVGGSGHEYYKSLGITTQNVTLGEFYISDPGTYNVTVKYGGSAVFGYDEVSLLNGSFIVTKSCTPSDFIELYSKTITDPSDYVSNVYDKVGTCLIGAVTVFSDNTTVYSKVFKEVDNIPAIRINYSNLTSTLTGSHNIKVVYNREVDGKEYSKQAVISFGSKTPTADDFIDLYNDTDIMYDDDIITILHDSTSSAGLDGVVSIYINNTLIFNKKLSGHYGEDVAITPENISGFFDGTYNVKVVYKKTNGKEYSKQAVINFYDIYGSALLPSVLTSSDVTTTYNGNKFIIATLKDNMGKPISDAIVSISIWGVTVPLITDSNGQVKITTNGLDAQKYDVEIKFDGNEVYESSATSIKVTVLKATLKLTASNKKFKKSVKTKKYTVTLKDNSAKPLNKITLTLKIKNKKFKATTNAKGKATFKITKLSKKGKFPATITFAGNSYYNSLSKKVKITVK
ncbi:MAG: hypothetical protein E7Z80_04065 [Methanobrevibacter thaueri]|nr:hypothetical protein [Methanobrevibacter thaueri]